MSATPDAEVEISIPLIKKLLRSQHPDLAALPLTIEDSGWDNVMARLGDDLGVRLPRRSVAAELIKNEQDWLPELSPHLPIAIPVPLRVGYPSDDYPWPWSIVSWFPGEPADLSPPEDKEAFSLAGFLKCLHQLPVPERNPPRNPFRDCRLSAKRKDVERRLDLLSEKTDLVTPELQSIWESAILVDGEVEKRWIVGDLHARNIVVNKGEISAVVDWGDVCIGDPAADLSAFWGVLGTSLARRNAVKAYGMSKRTETRARGWAILFGALLLETGLNGDCRHAAMGELTLRRVLEDG